MRARTLLLVALLSCAPRHAARDAAWTAMTINAQFDSKDPASIVDAIRRESPDLVCVQEVTDDFVKRVASLEYAHSAFEPAKGTWGIGLASRHPLRDVEVFEQAPHRMPAIEATVALPAGDVRVVCVHFFPPGAKRDPKKGLLATMRANAKLRAAQAESLVARLRDEKRPTLVLGDFNEGAGGDAMDVLSAAGFANACVRCGGTWPRRVPIARVDHVLARKLSARARVVSAGASDHRAVVASVGHALR